MIRWAPVRLWWAVFAVWLFFVVALVVSLAPFVLAALGKRSLF